MSDQEGRRTHTNSHNQISIPVFHNQLLLCQRRNEVLRPCSALGVLSTLGHTGGTSTSTSGDGPISRHHPEKRDLGLANGGDGFYGGKGPDGKPKNRANSAQLHHCALIPRRVYAIVYRHLPLILTHHIYDIRLHWNLLEG